jgi:putative transcriptional regulator
MTIRHHPSETLLTGFAAGTLDPGQHVAVATHLVNCSHCANWVHVLEHVGGVFLADMPPTEMSSDAFARVEARLKEPVQAVQSAASGVSPALANVKGLPAFVRSYPAGPWKWIAPRMHLAPIVLPGPSETRVFLLRSGPGTRLLEHTHTGAEMTCVLQGGFSHEGGHYGPGDFDFGDATMDHHVFVEPDEDCICLIAMKGDLRLRGLLGRLMQPLVRM